MVNYTSFAAEVYKVCCWSIQALVLNYTSLNAEQNEIKMQKFYRLLLK
jgi:hypothetical protein